MGKISMLDYILPFFELTSRLRLRHFTIAMICYICYKVYLRVPTDTEMFWSEWSDWSICSRTCGKGVKSRYKDCMLPYNMCPEDPLVDIEEHYGCHMNVQCPLNGKWTRWSQWTDCSMTCKKGYNFRQRTCSKPKAKYGGRECKGHSKERRECNLGICPIHGGWGDWGQWGLCQSGYQKRSRRCNKPRPQHRGAKFCEGRNETVRYCGGGQSWGGPPPKYGRHGGRGFG